METFKITLEQDRLIKDIQDEFNALYPFLKIEFSKTNVVPGIENAGSKSRVRIKDLSEFSPGVTVDVNKHRTVAELRDECLSKVGLTIHLSRKSGNVWNRVTLTDHWTLEGQNDAGQFISSEMSGVSTLPIKVA